jgi:hypothetical protein
MPWCLLQEVSCPLYLSNTPCSNFTVHVHEVGLFQVKGDPGPTEVVQLSLSHLTGRLALLPPEPPKGKGQCLEKRSGCVHVVPGVPLPAAAEQAAASMLPALRAQAAAALAAAAAAAAAAGTAGGSLPPRPQQQQFRRSTTLPGIATMAANTFRRASWKGQDADSPAARAGSELGSTLQATSGLPASVSLSSNTSSRRLPSSVAALSLSLRQRSSGTVSSSISRATPMTVDSQSSRLGPIAAGSTPAAASNAAAEEAGAAGPGKR